MDPPDQARVTCIDGVESQHVAIMPTLACPHEGAVGVDRHDLEVVSLPDRHVVADLHALQLWDDAVSTLNPIVINPVITVPAGAPVSYLRQPGPDLLQVFRREIQQRVEKVSEVELGYYCEHQ